MTHYHDMSGVTIGLLDYVGCDTKILDEHNELVHPGCFGVRIKLPWARKLP